MVALVLLAVLPLLQYSGTEELGSCSSSRLGSLEFNSLGALWEEHRSGGTLV